ncbi:aryl-alcohol dehydrogenase-like predicted oxidoreductase [Planomicrobium soli]|uniref:Aryl-alcohol dehydrogenase-like predicted oxidoreductase n=1 Tax=Planomicrobium soli TaxID=1176648 RepID=A0A2P8H5A5_9BACL|nr:aldo/keto reductase [Planomicrobium soli]PSL41380.1 aryl-alcohol dehydrogenase-like predicted oxidoreductase [Planomicrobium soli]
MRFSMLKKTDLQISVLGLGTNAVGGHNLYQDLNEEDGKNLVRAALEQGITFIDTADVYGEGRSEELVGEVLKEFERDQYVIATKGGSDWRNGSKNNSPAYLRGALEDSLKRLQLDSVDLYYIHWPDEKTPLGEAVAELSRLKQEGKIKAIGVSNVSLEQLKQANGSLEISAVQLQYNMFQREIEKDLLPYCVQNNISVVAYGPLAYGILGGEYSKDFQLEEGDWRNSSPLFQSGNFEKYIDKVEQLKEIAEQKGTDVSNLALAWLLEQPGIDAVIPGGKRPEQVQSNIAAAEIRIESQLMDKIEKILQEK